MLIMPLENQPGASQIPDYSAKRIAYEMNREARMRAVERRRLVALHGQPPTGMEWYEDPDSGRLMTRRMRTGRPPSPRSEAQIREAAIKVKEAEWDDERNTIAWLRADHAVLILKRFSDLFSKHYYEVGTPARDVAGNMLMAIQDKIGQYDTFPKARGMAKSVPVDVSALRGHPVIDPGGKAVPTETTGSVADDIAAGTLSIGE